MVRGGGDLDAELVAVRSRASGSLPRQDFFRGAMETALEPDELLCEARLPLLPDDTRFGFAEFSRRAGDYAQAMALAVLHLDGALITAARIGLGGVEAVPAPHCRGRDDPRRTKCRARRHSTRRPPQPRQRIEPLQDPQTDAQYRRELTHAMVYRALMRACPPSGAQG